MRKNIGNGKVIRAIAIGLSAMIATTSLPMTVLAEEAGGGSEDNNTYENVENGVADSAQSAAETASASAETASESVSNIPVIGLDGNIIETETGVKAENYSVKGIEVDKNAIADDITDAKNDLTDANTQLLIMENTADTSAQEGNLSGIKTKVEDDIAAAADAIEDGTAAVQRAESAENKADANGTVKNKADAAVSQAETVKSKEETAENLISEAQGIVEKANADINEPAEEGGTSLQDQFDAAANSQEMSTVYNQMVAIVNKATTDFQTKVEEYTTAKGEYETAQTSFENLLEDFVKAYCGENGTPDSPEEGSYLAEIKAAISDFEAAKLGYNSASDGYSTDSSAYAELLDAINKQICLSNDAALKANSDAGDAIAKLSDAASKIKQLKEYAEAAYAAINPNLIASAQAIENAKKQLKDEKENATDSRVKELEENLFKAYVASCYIPLKENGKVAEDGIIVEPQYDSGAAPYYKVSYKVGEESKEIYLSFGIDSDGNVTLSKIADEVITANKALLDAKAKGAPEDKFEAFYYEKDGKKSFVIISETELAKKNEGVKEITAADGKKVIVTDDDQFVVDGEPTKSYSIDGSEVDATSFVIPENETTRLKTIKRTENNNPEYMYNEETGEVVKTVKTDVTTTVYHEATLSSSSDFDSKADAEADLKQKINGLNEKDIKPEGALDNAITEGTEEVDKYSASGVYVSTFDAKISFEKVNSQNLYQYGSDTLVTIEDGSGKVLVKNFRLTGEVSSLEVTGANDSIIGSGNNMYCVVKQGEDADFYNTAHWDKDAITGVKVARVIEKTVSVKDLEFSNYGNPHKEYEFEEWCQKNGIALIGIPKFKGNGANTTITYYCVADESVTISATASDEDTKNAKTDDERKAAAKKALDEKASGKTLFGGERNGLSYESAGKISVGNGKYSYSIGYTAWDSTTTTSYIEKETFGDANGIDEFNSGEYSGTDVTNADSYALLKKYEDLKNKVGDAKEKVDEFKKDINELNIEISRLEKEKIELVSEIDDLPSWELDDSKPSDKIVSLYTQLMNLKTELNTLRGNLEDKEAGLEGAQRTLENLQEQLAEDEEALNDQRAREEEARRRSGGGDEGGSTGGGTDTTFVAPVTPIASLTAGLPATGVAGVRRGGRTVASAAGNVGGEGIEEELNGGAGDKKPVVEEVEKKVADTKEKKDTKAIKDPEVPLAEAPIEENNMSWWWLLLVAIAGATGYEIYKKHEEKKKEKAAVADSVKKNEK